MTAPEMNQSAEIERLRADNTALRRAQHLTERERDESYQREAATAEVLRAMGRSAADLQSVLDALVINAARLAESDDASIGLLKDGRPFWVSSLREGRLWPEALRSAPRPFPIPLDAGTYVASAILGRRMVAVHGGAEAIAGLYPQSAAIWRQSPYPVASAVCVPLLRGDGTLGMLMVRRASPAPFSDRQLALLETFADQAVIAIENARLFDEVQNRTREVEARNSELAEALEQQAAVSEVLRLIGSRPGDLEGVMTALIARVSQRIGADSGVISRITLMGEQTYVAWRYTYDPDHQVSLETGFKERLRTGLSLDFAR